MWTKERLFHSCFETKQLRLNTLGGTKTTKHTASMKVDLSDVCILTAYLTSATRFLLKVT